MISKSGYSLLSIITHWLTAILVIALFITHEAERGSTSFAFHVSFGAFAGLFLLWRVWYRIRRGGADKVDQHPMLNFLSDLVRWSMLLSITGIVITGYLLPWSLGQPIDMMGLFGIPSPFDRSRGFHEAAEKSHDFLGHIIIPLILLHIIGTIKHAVIDKDQVLKRMVKPAKDGR